MNMHVTPDSGGANPCLLEAVDIHPLESQVMKILGAFELIESIAKREIANGGKESLNHVELVASTFADVTCGMLDDLKRIPPNG